MQATGEGMAIKISRKGGWRSCKPGKGVRQRVTCFSTPLPSKTAERTLPVLAHPHDIIKRRHPLLVILCAASSAPITHYRLIL